MTAATDNAAEAVVANAEATADNLKDAATANAN